MLNTHIGKVNVYLATQSRAYRLLSSLCAPGLPGRHATPPENRYVTLDSSIILQT